MGDQAVQYDEGQSRKRAKREGAEVEPEHSDDQKVSEEDQWVQSIVEAVDATFFAAGETVHNFLEQRLQLNADQLNRVLAACIIQGPMEIGEHKAQPPRAARQLADIYKVKIPSTYYNGLQGNNGDCITHFMRDYQDILRKGDRDLVKLASQIAQKTRFNQPAFLNSVVQLLSDGKSDQMRSNIHMLATSMSTTYEAWVQNTPQSNDPVDNLDEALHDRLQRDRVSVITGTGVSMATVIPSHRTVVGWSGFLDALGKSIQAFKGETDAWFAAQRLEINGKLDLFGMADKLDEAIKELEQSQGRGGPVDYTRFIYPLCSSARPSEDALGPTSLPAAIRALQAPIGTTNYDMLLEECLGRHEVNLLHKDVLSLILDRRRPITNFHEKAVYHLHGVWYAKEGFVLNSNEYHQHGAGFMSALLHLLDKRIDSCRSILFIGCGVAGVTDHHFVIALKLLQIHHNLVKHFVLARDTEVPEIEHELARLGITNVTVLGFGGRHDDLGPFLWNVAHKAGHVCTKILTVKHGAAPFQESKLTTVVVDEAKDPIAQAVTADKDPQEASAAYHEMKGNDATDIGTAANSVWVSTLVQTNRETRLHSTLRPR